MARGESRVVAPSLDRASALSTRAVTLTGDPDAENSIATPTSVVPSNGVAPVTNGSHTAVAFTRRGARADQLES